MNRGGVGRRGEERGERRRKVSEKGERERGALGTVGVVCGLTIRDIVTIRGPRLCRGLWAVDLLRTCWGVAAGVFRKGFAVVLQYLFYRHRLLLSPRLQPSPETQPI